MDVATRGFLIIGGTAGIGDKAARVLAEEGAQVGVTGAGRGPSVLRDRWRMNVSLGRLGVPAEVGDVIAFLLSARAVYLTGSLVNIDAGTTF